MLKIFYKTIFLVQNATNVLLTDGFIQIFINFSSLFDVTIS